MAPLPCPPFAHSFPPVWVKAGGDFGTEALQWSRFPSYLSTPLPHSLRCFVHVICPNSDLKSNEWKEIKRVDSFEREGSCLYPQIKN